MHRISCRPLVALVALLVPGATLLAQSPGMAQPTNRIGIVAGLNLATVTGQTDNSIQTKNKSGFMAGVFLVRPIAEHLDIQPELIFTQKGAVASGSGAELSVTLNYVELPVLFRYNIPVSSSGVRPYVYAGPSFAYRTSCDFTASGGGITASGSCKSANSGSSSDEPKTVDVGGVVGGGIAFAIGGRAISFGARYEAGFLDLNKNPAPGESRASNRVLTFLGTLEFPMP